jgi:hypothetical protein
MTGVLEKSRIEALQLTFSCKVFRGVWIFAKFGKSLEDKPLGSRFGSLSLRHSLQFRSVIFSPELRQVSTGFRAKLGRYLSHGVTHSTRRETDITREA